MPGLPVVVSALFRVLTPIAERDELLPTWRYAIEREEQQGDDRVGTST
jgi:hypothetical protein